VRDKNGEIYTVRYDQVNAMLLNEFLKDHKRVQELNSIVAKQDANIAQQHKDFAAAIAQQQNEIASLTKTVKEQAAQIQKVSTQIEVRKTPPTMVLNNQ
jgi:septal ring factor EnvC (AmiA/AmiB activator)